LLRSPPSGKLVVISASAVGAITAPPAPCIALAVSSHHWLVANPPSRDAAENSSSPKTNTRRRPRMSPARPPSRSRPPKVTASPGGSGALPAPEAGDVTVSPWGLGARPLAAVPALRDGPRLAASQVKGHRRIPVIARLRQRDAPRAGVGHTGTGLGAVLAEPP